jgi:hypothetical protein
MQAKRFWLTPNQRNDAAKRQDPRFRANWFHHTSRCIDRDKRSNVSQVVTGTTQHNAMQREATKDEIKQDEMAIIYSKRVNQLLIPTKTA